MAEIDLEFLQALLSSFVEFKSGSLRTHIVVVACGEGLLMSLEGRVTGGIVFGLLGEGCHAGHLRVTSQASILSDFNPNQRLQSNGPPYLLILRCLSVRRHSIYLPLKLSLSLKVVSSFRMLNEGYPPHPLHLLAGPFNFNDPSILFAPGEKMGRATEELDFKSQLVTEICSISTRFPNACAHRRRRSPIKSHFIDWYRLLRVEEDADTDSIRKKYLKLALQLHPDKNKHPKAEIAFKLVSEAYACLSDNSKRRAFNLERWKSFCTECNKTPFKTCNSPSNAISTKLKGLNPTDRSRSKKIFRGLKEIRDRFKEEAGVIENCLRANSVSRKESPLFNPSDYQRTRKEFPLFNPSDYPFQGYPHLRTRIYKNPENLWYLQTGNARSCEHRRVKYDFPVFEIRSEKGPFRSRTVRLHS